MNILARLNIARVYGEAKYRWPATLAGYNSPRTIPETSMGSEAASCQPSVLRAFAAERGLTFHSRQRSGSLQGSAIGSKGDSLSTSRPRSSTATPEPSASSSTERSKLLWGHRVLLDSDTFDEDDFGQSAAANSGSGEAGPGPASKAVAEEESAAQESPKSLKELTTLPSFCVETVSNARPAVVVVPPLLLSPPGGGSLESPLSAPMEIEGPTVPRMAERATSEEVGKALKARPATPRGALTPPRGGPVDHLPTDRRSLEDTLALGRSATMPHTEIKERFDVFERKLDVILLFASKAAEGTVVSMTAETVDLTERLDILQKMISDTLQIASKAAAADSVVTKNLETLDFTQRVDVLAAKLDESLRATSSASLGSVVTVTADTIDFTQRLDAIESKFNDTMQAASRAAEGSLVTVTAETVDFTQRLNAIESKLDAALQFAGKTTAEVCDTLSPEIQHKFENVKALTKAIVTQSTIESEKRLLSSIRGLVAGRERVFSCASSVSANAESETNMSDRNYHSLKVVVDNIMDELLKQKKRLDALEHRMDDDIASDQRASVLKSFGNLAKETGESFPKDARAVETRIA